MPTNLPPEYFEADKRYRQASSPQEKIARLEDLISTVPKHKGTEKLLGDLRKRLSKLRTAAQTRKAVGRQESAFQIDREGAGQVVVVGPPNSGKSALVAALTNASPEVSPAPYTTWTPTPGMMPVENVQIQLIDTPPLTHEYIEPELAELIRRSDLILLVVDLQAYPLEQIDTCLEILAQIRVVPADVDLPAAGDGQRVVKPFLLVVNKVDDESLEVEFDVLCELLEGGCPLLPLSVATGRHVDRLKKTIFTRLDIVRVYAKPPGAEPDRNSPFVLKRGATIGEFAGKIHQDFERDLKSARVWGSGAFEGQMVGRDHELADEDVVELRV